MLENVVFWRAIRDGYSYEAAQAKQRRADEDAGRDSDV